MKKGLLKILALVLTVALFIPTSIKADDPDNIIRKTTTNYFTTINFIGTYTNESTGASENFERTSNEIAGNCNSDAVLNTIKNLKSEFTTWANDKGATNVDTNFDGEITDYYYDAHDEITQSNVGENIVSVGDINDINDISQGQITINTILDKHQTYVVRMNASREKIKKVNLTVTLPFVRDEIVVQNGNWDTQSPQANIKLENNARYELYDSNGTSNYMYYILPGTNHEPFSGTFQKDQTYTMEIWLKATGDDIFDNNVEVEVNGTTAQLEDFLNGRISVLYDFVPPVRQQNYTLTTNDATATFTYDEGYNFNLNFINVLSLKPEELQQFDVTEEQFNEILNYIKNNIKEYGELIGVYAVEINDGDIGYTNSVKIKVKLTDEMKKYNKFQFIYLDDNNNFKAGEVVDFEIKDGYLIGTLPHLSTYALVGNKIEEINNPKTGDNIYAYVGLIIVSSLSLLGIKKVKKEI